MALVVADRVQETTTTTGTGTYTLAGAKDGFQSFAAVGDGNTTYYACTDGTDYEVGIGTYTATGTTLARTTIIESSNSDAAVNWGAGSKDIFVTSPADKTLLVGRNLYADNPSSATMPSATGTNAVAIGDSAAASAQDAISIGDGATNAGAFAVAIGWNAAVTSNGTRGIAIGSSATTDGQKSFAAGDGATITNTGISAVALGTSYASGTDSFAAAIGNNGSAYGAKGANSIAMGLQAKATGIGSVALGRNGPTASGTVSFAAQRGQATGNGSIAMGHFNSYGLPTASGLGAIVIGDGSTGSATRSVVLGNDNTSSHNDAVVIGSGASSSAADQITLGHTDQTVRISSSYTLPTSDGTNGQVLTTDGAGAVTFADAGGAFAYTIDNKTAAYTVVSGDLGKIINCTSGTFTITLTAAATLGSGFSVYIWNTGTGAITIDPNASETIDGETTYILRQNEGTEVVCDGSNFSTGAKKTMRGYAENLPSTYGKPVASGAGAIALGNRNGDAVYLSQAQGTRSFAVNGYATANYSAAIGQNSGGGGAEAGGAGAMALGGSYASGTDSFAAAIANNSSTYGATGANSIAIGELSKATGNEAVSIGSGAVSSNDNSIAMGNINTSATASAAIAIGVGADATGAHTTAIGYLSQATSTRSQAFGRSAVSVGDRSTAMTESYASGLQSFAAAIANNTSSYGATGSYAVAMGLQAKAYSTNSIGIGSSTQAGNQAVAIGVSNTATSTQSTAIGYANQSSANNAFAFGSQAKSATKGKIAYAVGLFSAKGDAQGGTFILRSDTTDATAEALTTNNSTASTDNQIILENNSAYAFHGTIVARESATDGTDCAAWKIEGLIRREGSASTTTLVNSATTVLDNTPSWGMALSADTTNGCLKIEVTGAASTNIRWVATIHTSEVTYA